MRDSYFATSAPALARAVGPIEPQKNLTGESQSYVSHLLVRCRHLLAVAAVVSICPPIENACQFGVACLLTGFCRRPEIEVVFIKSAFLSLRSFPCRPRCHHGAGL